MRNQRTPSPSPSPPHLRPLSPYYSPDYSLGMHYSSQKSSQLKLSQKITKLKHALHSAQSHNEQLHNKAKHYKDLYSSQTQMAKQQVKRYKKKYSILQREYEKKEASLKQLRELMEKETRDNLQGMREKVNRIKELESRVVELETLNFDLNAKLHEKGQKIKDLQTSIEKGKIEAEEELSRKLARAEKDIQIKSRECTQLHRQNTTIKQTLKQQSRKLQKSSLTVYELTCQNKSTIEQHKRSLSVITSLQKTLTSQSQNIQKQRNQNLILQKQCLELKTKYDDLQHKYKYEIEKYGKLQGQYEEIVAVYNGLNCRYQQLIMSQYQVHKDLEREINGVAKEIARRYMNSGKGSTAASFSAKSVGKKELLNFGNQ